MTSVISLDFELASTVDLSDVGAVEWTKHPNTLPVLCGFAIDHAEPECFEFDALSNWRSNAAAGGAHAAHLENLLLNAIIIGGAEIHAWNANFEFNVWNNICVPRFGWPKLEIEKFFCTMCAAACAGLPMNLGEAAIAVGSPYLKDKQGQALMKRMARPRSDKGGVVRWWHREDPAKVAQLMAYNIGDVKAEREVHMRVPRMTKREREIWLVDQRMNMRGLPTDAKLLDKMYEITLAELLDLNAAILQLTNGAVRGSTQAAALLAWVQAGGYPFSTLERDTLFDFIRTPEFQALAPEVQDVLLTRAEAAKTSTAKLLALSNHSGRDGFVRNLIQYGGAVRTLRWGGRGPQIQNFPKPVIDKNFVAPAIEQILLGADGPTLRHLYGRPLDVISSCLRGVFRAPAGHKFVVCDYHAIEAVVLGWLAEDEDRLDVFRRGEDIYVYTAQGVGSTDRQLGKVLCLACGYGMGHVKFLTTAAGYGLFLNPLQAKDAVDAFRQANPRIVSLWHGVEATAKQAIRRPSDEFQFRKLRLRMASPSGRLAGALLLTLPSGRHLVYRNVRIENERLVFWGVHQITKQWQQLDTYGGKLVENATQAVARDLLADAIVDLDNIYPGALCTTIHDEVIGMTTDEDASHLLTLMKNVMGSAHPWGAGLPLSAAGAIIERYRKL